MRNSKIKKFFLNPWTVGIGVAIFSFILTIIGDVVKGEKLLSTFIAIVTWLWNAILSFLTFDLKVWWVLLGVIALFFFLWIYSKISDLKESVNTEPKFVQYTQDYLLGFKWEWTWEKDCFDKYSIENLQPICTDCDTPLRYDLTGYYRLKCLRCNKSYSGNVPQEDDVKTLIYDNVKKKFFKREEETNGNQST